MGFPYGCVYMYVYARKDGVYIISMCAVKEGAEEEEKRLKEEITRIREEMDQLKKVLYARFGDSIHLEE